MESPVYRGSISINGMESNPGLAWVALAIVAVGTGLRKFQLLNQSRSMAIPPQVPGAVVGTPIGTTDDGKVM